MREVSEAYQAYMDEQRPKMEAAAAARKKQAEAYYQFRAKHQGEWLPMSRCPFAALESLYRYEGCIHVSDGDNVALATVRQRFGTPIMWKVQPKMVWDVIGGQPMMTLVGGVQEKIKAPRWWFKWSLIDEHGSMNYAGGEETGKDEVDFTPTHWMPMPVGPK